MRKMDNTADYYIDPDTGLIVFTIGYHLRRGYCCSKRCKHCPYLPRYQGGEKVDPQYKYLDLE